MRRPVCLWLSRQPHRTDRQPIPAFWCRASYLRQFPCRWSTGILGGGWRTPVDPGPVERESAPGVSTPAIVLETRTRALCLWLVSDLAAIA